MAAETPTPRPWSLEFEATPLRRAQARLIAAPTIADLRLRAYNLCEAGIELAQAQQACEWTARALAAAQEELARLLEQERAAP